MTAADGEAFDRNFYDELIGCLNGLDPTLLDSINAQWAGFRICLKIGRIEWCSFKPKGAVSFIVSKYNYS